MNRYALICLSILIVIMLFSCAAENILSIDEYYSMGQEFEQQNDAKKALKAYENLLKFYPRSNYTKEVLLKVADFKFEREKYIDALADYLIYQKYYESIDESEYIQYKIAKCYFHSRLSYNRDQTFLNKAIYEFQNLIYTYPDSSYLPEAIEKIRIMNTEKAKAELEVAVQYEKIRGYQAARRRLEYILDNYPGLGFEEEVYFRLSRIHLRADRQEEYEKYFALLQTHYPDSKYIKKLEG